MIANIFTFITLLTLSFLIASVLASRHPQTNPMVFRALIFYHCLLALAYYLQALSKPSDSWAYYNKIVANYRGPTWGDFYGVSTTFIEFIGYPFVKYLALPYESMMMIFAWFGLLGFFYFYVSFRERIYFTHKFFGVDLVLLILFLPNLHFWSASLGKGSVIFLGIGLFFYSLHRLPRRIIPLVVGALLIYHVRPHVLFIILVGAAIGLAFSSKGITWRFRVLVLLMAVFAFYYIYDDVMALIGFDEEDLIGQSTELSKRVEELSGATSGVDLMSYSLPMKLFTFLFRPLFFDAPGILGIIVSFENLFYLLLFLKVARVGFITFLWRADYAIKTALISFFGVSFALAQISANLGLAIRQKSQVMILFLFIIVAYFDHERIQVWRAARWKRDLQAKKQNRFGSRVAQ